MIYGLYLSTAGMQAQQAKQTILANNLANSQTPGFKRDLAVMRARANAIQEDPKMAAYQMPVLRDQGGGVYAQNGTIDLSAATLVTTGNKTDVALDGRGFFTVQGTNGEKLLTRDGRFLVNNEGQLVTALDGHPVLSSEGSTIKLNPKLPIHIGQNGTITQGDGSASTRLGIVDVKDPRRLMKVGGDLLTVDNPSALTEAPAATVARQGSIESSGVDPITEMINMMEGMRAFEANAKLVTLQDQTLQQLTTIGRVA